MADGSKPIRHSDSIPVVLESLSHQPIFENLKWLTSREAVTYLRLPSTGTLRNTSELCLSAEDSVRKTRSKLAVR